MANVMCVSDFKTKFELKLKEITKSECSALISDTRYDELIKEVEQAKVNSKKTTSEYRRLNRFDVLTIGESKKLIVPPSKTNGDIIYFVKCNEMFDILHMAHINCGHGGRNRMEHSIKQKYKNITRDIIVLYLQLCEICNKKHAHPKKGLVIKPILSKTFNSRAQVDLIDMQSNKDGNFKFILVYQDHFTKFVSLRPLKTKTASEVAYNLIDIFCIFGAPCILQSDNGREFVNHIINDLVLMWDGLKIVHGKPRHSQSQGSVERANQDIEKIIYAWMEENQSRKWSEGLRFCQFAKNNAYHAGIKQPPYEAMFGKKVSLGLKMSFLPNDIINNVNDENDLLQFVENENENEMDVLNGNENEMEATDGLVAQAKKMKLLSENLFPPLTVETTVKIPVPCVDRGKVDANNVLGVILSVTDDGFYKIGTKNGILSSLYARNQIFQCKEQFISSNDVPNIEIPLRTASTQNSLTGGQEFIFCSCKTKCTTRRCKCKQLNILCSSKCHGSNMCSNK
ncbi:KRAB-A domain-containing protein 2-like [Myzus persicae]|uniref:KRAB-A domain-containing protein 2-like n=1 Tax=Myzus persicae TaxID=13164 RepID=UPI000B935DCE|nr:KRAB-A domain-containing protein 2-like [Myzus persicae]